MHRSDSFEYAQLFVALNLRRGAFTYRQLPNSRANSSGALITPGNKAFRVVSQPKLTKILLSPTLKSMSVGVLKQGGMPRILKRVDIPASSDPASDLGSGNFPPRPVLPCGVTPQVLQTTKFIVFPQYRRWEDPYFDGLRVLLAAYPPPIELPTHVQVRRKEIHPKDQAGEKSQSMEGKKWEISWVKLVEISHDQKNWVPAVCDYKLYHKFHPIDLEANWRVTAAIELLDPALVTPGDRAALEALSSAGGVYLRLQKGHSFSQVKRCALSIGPQAENCLIRPATGTGSLDDGGHRYIILKAEDFEWCRPTTWSYARNNKREDAAHDAILERGHYRTQPIAYRFSEHSSSEWLRGQVANSALMGVPRCWVEAANLRRGKDFLDTSLSSQLVTQWCKGVEKTDVGFRFRLELPWSVNGHGDLGLPGGRGVSAP